MASSTASHEVLFTQFVDARVPGDGPFVAIYSAELSLSAGETIDFSVNYGEDTEFSADETLFDIVIREESHVHLGFFLRGDCTGDGAVNVVDPLALLFANFGGVTFPCRAAADANANGDTSRVEDAVVLLYFLYLAGCR